MILDFTDNVNYIISGVTGTCLTREELANRLQIYDRIVEKWSGFRVVEAGTRKRAEVPHLTLLTPGQHEHDENTRYEITMREKDSDGFCTGIKVNIMPEGACKTQADPKPSASSEPEKTNEPVSTPEPALTPDPAASAAPEPDQGTGYIWRLINTEIEQCPDEIGEVHKTFYQADELMHFSKKTGIVEIPEHRVVGSYFTAFCSAPPKTVMPGEEVVMKLNLYISGDNDVYHYGAIAYLCFGKLGGQKDFWQAVQEGQSNQCQMDAIGDWGHPPVRISNVSVKGVFPESTNEGQQRVLTFDACGSQTYWTYELQRIN